MHETVAIVSIPIAVFAGNLLFNPHHRADFYEQKAIDGRAAIWNDDICKTVGSLVCELDDRRTLIDKLKERRKILETEEITDLDIPLPDYSERIADDIPYIESVSGLIEDIRNSANERAGLHSMLDDLPLHRERIGSILLGYIFLVNVLSISYFIYEWISVNHSIAIFGFISVVSVFWIGSHYRKLRNKRSEIINEAPLEGVNG